MIVGVYVRSEHIIVMLPKPNRHCDCFEYAEKAGIDFKEAKFGYKGEHQGFYTHTGKLLDREQALRYVKRIGQKTLEPVKGALFSEDVW